jgi:hypothetical protein
VLFSDQGRLVDLYCGSVPALLDAEQYSIIESGLMDKGLFRRLEQIQPNEAIDREMKKKMMSFSMHIYLFTRSIASFGSISSSLLKKTLINVTRF